MVKRKFLFVFLIVFLASSFLSTLPVQAQEKTYLKVFEKDGTSLKIPTINMADSVVSYQDTKDFYQFNITLLKIPESNIFNFPLETQGLQFILQRPLTEELNTKDYDFLNATHAIIKDQIVEHRPENIVNSYAVYKTKIGIGETGKLYHVFRPLLVDAKGVTSWANLSMTKDSMTIICDNDFLLKATYPLTIDPSFGYTTIGASTSTLDNEIDGSAFTCPAAGTGNSMTVALRYDATSWQGKVKCAIYLASDLSEPIANGETEERTLTLTSTKTWYTFNFTTPPTLSASTDYVLYAWAENVANAAQIARDDDAGVDRWYYTKTYGAWPSIPASDRTGKYSIYCNYTTGGAPQSVSVELSETCAASASLYTQKSLHRSLTESITITASTYTKKTLIRVAGESTTITTTIESSKGIFTVLTELLETVPTTASIITQKAMHITKIGTLDISAALEVIKHLAATFIVLPEACGISASLQTILPILALTSEEWAMVAIVLSISVSLAICVGLLYSKRRNDYFPYG